MIYLYIVIYIVVMILTNALIRPRKDLIFGVVNLLLIERKYYPNWYLY